MGSSTFRFIDPAGELVGHAYGPLPPKGSVVLVDDDAPAWRVAEIISNYEWVVDKLHPTHEIVRLVPIAKEVIYGEEETEGGRSDGDGGSVPEGGEEAGGPKA